MVFRIQSASWHPPQTPSGARGFGVKPVQEGAREALGLMDIHMLREILAYLYSSEFFTLVILILVYRLCLKKLR